MCCADFRRLEGRPGLAKIQVFCVNRVFVSVMKSWYAKLKNCYLYRVNLSC